ncbi:MAG: hypothetical protein ACK44D_05060 [Bacteroidia bacterium]
MLNNYINRFAILILFSGVLLSTACEKKEEHLQSSERTNYIGFKQDGVPVVVDSISVSSQSISIGGYKHVQITFFDIARNRYGFNFIDSSLDLSYLTPKTYQGLGSSFIHLGKVGYFAGSSQFSSFTCTKSNRNTKRFSGHFEIMYVNEPNRTDTILVTEGVVENLKLP